MIAALALAAYAVVAAALGGRALARAAWVDRFPHLGILAWLALTGSVVISGFLAALALVVPALPLRSALARALGADPVAVGEHYDSPTALVAVVLALAAAAALRLALVAVRTLARDSRHRAELRDQVAVAGRPGADGTTVLTSTEPAAWCVPGRRGTVVVTTGALALLDPTELRLVLGHERRHLRGRHHAVLTTTGVLAEAFAPVPLFGRAHRGTQRLVEMAADDVARLPAERRSLARALVTMAEGPVAGATLSAGGTATLARVRRLGSGVPAAGRGARLAVATAATILAALPVALLVAPAAEAAVRDCYPASSP